MIITLAQRFHAGIVEFSDTAPVTPEEKSRIQNYIVFLMLGIPCMVVFGILNLFKGDPALSFFTIASCLGLLAGLYTLKIVKNGLWVYRINTLFYVLLIGYMVTIGGESGSKALWAYTLPLICCFLMGYAEGLIWSLILLLVALITFFLPTNGVYEFYHYPIDFQVRFLITYTISTFIAVWLEHSRSYYQEKSRQDSARLQEQHIDLKNEIQSRATLEETLRKIARTDHLTGLLNRGAFFELAEREWKKHSRYSNSYSFAILDIDDFKVINDRYGHPVGDMVLREVAKCFSQSVRDFDVIGRIGGEEFAAVMLETDIDAAKKIAERIRSSIEQLSVPHNSMTIQCTVSIGIYTARTNTESLNIIYNQADLALYQAKDRGKNLVFLCTD